jgi:sec-independent protein translocase protein TatB
MFLDPAKLLVILIVALVVLGPDKLPGVARQLGAAWGEIRRFRERLETEVRGSFPDLPSTHQVAQAVRSPLAFLDQLADAHEREQQTGGDQNAGQQGVGLNGGAGGVADQPPADTPLSIRPSTPLATGESSEEGVSALTNGNSDPAPRRVGRTRPWRGSEPSETAFIPDDPSMN